MVDAVLVSSTCSNLQHLKHLDLQHVDGLAQARMTALTRLDISYNLISSLHGLKNLSGLREFSASANKITNESIAVLGFLTGLEKLDLSSGGAEGRYDVTPLSALTNLRHLYLFESEYVVDDLRPLANLVGLWVYSDYHGDVEICDGCLG
jgi:Leucine-rich repeat (LRR) protein